MNGIWIQCGSCGGDTISLLNTDKPSLTELFEILNIEFLVHPSFSISSANTQKIMIDEVLSGKRKLDLLCIEGAIELGPGGTGMFDLMFGEPKKVLVRALAEQAEYVLAVGTCACFGGIPSYTDASGTGLQYHHYAPGGFLGNEFRSKSGYPVINLPGCPLNPKIFTSVLTMIGHGIPLELGQFNTPKPFYSTLVHQGCTRNEYHEYRVEEEDFGEKGCLFFYRGCHGPLTFGPCNKYLWADRTSPTRVGVPCFGCTSPDFPKEYPFFKTRNIEGVPIDVPPGIKRAHYLVYKNIAAVAAPERLRKRETDV